MQGQRATCPALSVEDNMNIKENNYTLEFPEEAVLPFEERVLASGLCDFALPMRFSTSKGVRSIYYECSGYTALSELKISNVRDIYEVLEKTMITLSKINEFLLDINKVSLDLDTIFYHLKHRDIKIAYVPEESDERIMRKILRLIERLGANGDATTKEYLKRTAEAIDRNNYSIGDIIRFIGNLKREMYLSGIR